MTQKKRSTQQVRIIGGKWKGRKLHFSGNSSLRPTLGRTRETLFNWLRPYITQSRCLDAFAGSGVLGFEALSLGAAEVVFIEQNPRTARALASTAELLGADTYSHLIKSSAITYLQQATRPFDIVFLDPPFNQPDLLDKGLKLLAQRRLVGRFVYAEARELQVLEAVCEGAGFELIKQTSAGDTVACLLTPNRNIAASPGQG